MSSAHTAAVAQHTLALLPRDALTQQTEHYVFDIVRKQMQAHALRCIRAAGKHRPYEPGANLPTLFGLGGDQGGNDRRWPLGKQRNE